MVLIACKRWSLAYKPFPPTAADLIGKEDCESNCADFIGYFYCLWFSVINFTAVQINIIRLVVMTGLAWAFINQ